MIFERTRYGRDNYLYVLAEGDDAAVVDPGDPDVAFDLCRRLGLRPRAVLHTHGHADHTGGTRELVASLAASPGPEVLVFGHGGDAGSFRPDQDLAETSEQAGGRLQLGRLHLRLHHTPAHTPGSMLFEWRGRLLTGDTLFWGGCGNCRHGGSVEQMARSFLGPLAALDGALEVHPGHDYAEANLPFVLDLEPGNGVARERLEAVRAAHREGREPEARIRFEQERKCNPFLRSWALAAELAARGAPCATPEDSFVALRRLRDSW